MKPRESSRRSAGAEKAWVLAALCVPAALYLLTLYPGLGGRLNPGDSAKFQYVGSVLGVPHQPGYPQYVMLTYLWSLLPRPESLATRMNLFSAVLALVAGGFLWHGVRRLTQSAGLATLATWTVLTSAAVWTFATEAEVHSLHLVWVAAVVWAIARWEVLRSPGALVAVLGLAAFSFGNHPASIVLLPALVVMAVGTGPKEFLRGRVLWPAIGWTALAASAYLFVLWRAQSDAPFIEGIRKGGGMADLLRSMSGRRFADQHLLGAGPMQGLRRAMDVGVEALRQLGPVVVGLAVFGAGSSLSRRRPVAMFLVAMVVGSLVFISLYQIGDWGAYVAPAWLAIVVLAALAVAKVPVRARTAAALTWLVVWGWLGWRDFGALSVPVSPHARERLVTAAPDGAVVLPYAQLSYPVRQFLNYYRYGVGLERDRGLTLETAEQAVLAEWRFLGDRPIVFERSGVVAWAQAYAIEHVASRTPDGDVIYTTGTEWPVERLGIDVSDGSIEIRNTGGRVLSRSEAAALVMVVSGEDGRVKGAMPFDGEGAAVRLVGDENPNLEAERRGADVDIIRFLVDVRSTDWIVVVLRRELFESIPDVARRVARAFRPPEIRGRSRRRAAAKRFDPLLRRAQSIESGGFESVVVFAGPRRGGRPRMFVDSPSALNLEVNP